MNDTTLDKISAALNKEIIKRMLIKYFIHKGFDDFNSRIYPPSLQDLTEAIPELDGKIEIEPFSENIDPTTGHIKLGWNLFVLGHAKMSLGFSEHNDIKDLNMFKSGPGPINQLAVQSAYEVTPKRIISFICSILGDSRAGFIQYGNNEYSEQPKRAPMDTTSGPSIYTKPGMVKPER